MKKTVYKLKTIFFLSFMVITNTLFCHDNVSSLRKCAYSLIFFLKEQKEAFKKLLHTAKNQQKKLPLYTMHYRIISEFSQKEIAILREVEKLQTNLFIAFRDSFRNPYYEGDIALLLADQTTQNLIANINHQIQTLREIIEDTVSFQRSPIASGY